MMLSSLPFWFKLMTLAPQVIQALQAAAPVITAARAAEPAFLPLVQNVMGLVGMPRMSLGEGRAGPQVRYDSLYSPVPPWAEQSSWWYSVPHHGWSAPGSDWN
jgi:hypothetical protein